MSSKKPQGRPGAQAASKDAGQKPKNEAGQKPKGEAGQKPRGEAGQKPKGGTARARMQSQREHEAKRNRRNTIIITSVVGVVILALIAFVTVMVLQNRRQTGIDEANQLTPKNVLAETGGIIANPDKAKDAKYTFSLYFDYQCPYCHEAEKAFGEVWQQLADEGFIKLDMHTMDFLDQGTNSAGLGPKDSSLRSGVMATCVANYAPDKYSKLHDLIFENQPEKEGVGYTDDTLKSLVKQVGVDGVAQAQVTNCFDKMLTKNYVEKTNENAFKNGITGTPAIKVNGKNPDYGDADKTAWWAKLGADKEAWKAAIEKAAEDKVPS